MPIGVSHPSTCLSSATTNYRYVVMQTFLYFAEKRVIRFLVNNVPVQVRYIFLICLFLVLFHNKSKLITYGSGRIQILP